MSSVTNDNYKTAENYRSYGVMIATVLRQAAAVADGVSQASQLTSGWKNQRDIANSMLKMAEEAQEFTQTYYWPKELTFLQEFTDPEDVEEMNVYGRRFAGHLMAPIAKAFAQQIKKIKCEFGRYYTSHMAISLQALYQSQATAMANAKILGYMKAFAWVQAKDNTNLKRRQQAIALGKGLMQQAAGLYKNALGGLAGANAEAIEHINQDIAAFRYAETNAKESVRTLDSEALDIARKNSMVDAMGESVQTASNSNQINFSNPYTSSSLNAGSNIYGGVTNGATNGAVGYSVAALTESLFTSGTASSFSTNADGADDATTINNWDRVGAKTISNDYHSNFSAQTEVWNNGDAGGNDLVRYGSHTYNFTDSRGDTGSITVNMDDFSYAWADALHNSNKDSTRMGTNDSSSSSSSSST